MFNATTPCRETRTLFTRLLLLRLRAQEKGPDVEQRHRSAEKDKHSSGKHLPGPLVARRHDYSQRYRDHQGEKCSGLPQLPGAVVAQTDVREKIEHGARTDTTSERPSASLGRVAD